MIDGQCMGHGVNGYSTVACRMVGADSYPTIFSSCLFLSNAPFEPQPKSSSNCMKAKVKTNQLNQ